VLQDAEGDVLQQSVSILAADGTAYSGTFYNAASGGSVVTSPFTPSAAGLLEVWTDKTTTRRALVRTSGAADLKSEFVYDPEDMMVVGMNRAAVLDGYAGVSDYVLRARPTTGGGTGNKIFAAQTQAGDTITEIAALGGGGGDAAMVAFYHNVDKGPFVIGNTRNWNANAGMYYSLSKLTGVVTGSYQGATWTYQSCATPSDGFNGSVDIPDHVVLNLDYFAQNILSGASQNHDGSGRAAELQCLVYQNTGTRSMACMTLGTHTGVTKLSDIDVALAGAGVSDDAFGDCAIISINAAQAFTGFGATVAGNTNIFTGGNPGYKQHLGGTKSDGTLCYALDSNGDFWSRNLLPRPGASPTIGTAARVWTQSFIGTMAVNNGTAANPSVALIGAGAYADGLFGVAGGSVIGFGIAGTEKARFNATGLTLASAMTISSIVSPTQLTTNTDDYNPAGLSTARLLQISASGAINLTGLAAQGTGFVVSVLNIGAAVITLKHEVTSSAVNRFNLPNGADIALAIHQSVELIYTGSRWKKLSG
jgi:hypothetical protein